MPSRQGGFNMVEPPNVGARGRTSIPRVPTRNDGGHMSENPNLITIDNSALILIDQQPFVAFSVQSIDRSLSSPGENLVPRAPTVQRTGMVQLLDSGPADR